MPIIAVRVRDDSLHEALDVLLGVRDEGAVVDERKREQVNLILRGEGALLGAPVVP